MLLLAIADFFKFKIAASVVVLACWPLNEQVRFLRGLSRNGIRAKFSCTANNFPLGLETSLNQIQGILYFAHKDDLTLEKVANEHFSLWYKWLIITDSNSLPSTLKSVRYDADITLLRTQKNDQTVSEIFDQPTRLNFEDVYMHPVEGAIAHPWATWNESNRFNAESETDRIYHRTDLMKFPLTITTPMGHYTEAKYQGSFRDYLLDNSKSVEESALGCGFSGAELLVEALNATSVLSPVLQWTSEEDNKSMVATLALGKADLSGGVLQPLPDHIQLLDYVMPLWPLRVGFTYLAERHSQAIFVMPFSASVWWSCLVTGLIIAAVQRLTSRTPLEREGAFTAVLATFLQQDASAVPEGASGRCAFTVLSLWAMMIYAYYSSAIVSAFMDVGQSGPVSLKMLADSNYDISAEDYDDVKNRLFDRETNWPDLEYLKKRKKTADFYQTMQKGVELLRQGRTAFHAEFNRINPNLKTLTDDQVCKLTYIDTIPKTLMWIVAPKRSQFTNILRITGCKINERGLAKRLIAEWRLRLASCRTSILAESVTISDVAPLLGISILGVVMSLVFLAMEMLHAKWRKKDAVCSTENLVPKGD